MTKAKNMMYMQYLEHLPFQDLEACLNHLETALTPTKYAGILHDKDLDEDGTPIAPHIHIMFQFENARSIANVAKLLNDKPQYIEKWNGDSTNGYSYLIHATTNSQDRYQYPIDEVIANFDYLNLMVLAKTGSKSASKGKDNKIIDDSLDKFYLNEMTREEVEETLTGSQYSKAKNRIEAVHQKVRQLQAEEWKNQLKETNLPIHVIWIYGKSGVGKTRLAKDIASKKEDEFFITGSSRDPFQHYQGQEMIIMDELRPTTFQYSDLLRMLDPYKDDIVMGASRYFDKPLTASTFIITSPYTPKEFYLKIAEDNRLFDVEIDSFKQLARRLSLVLYLDQESIYVALYHQRADDFIVEYDDKERNPYTGKTAPDSQNVMAKELYKNIIHDIKNNDSINEKKAESQLD